MSCIFRTGISKFRAGTTGLCKVTSTNNVPNIQIALISTRETRKNRPPRPPPFPYKDKKFGLWAQTFDDTIFRFDDNTKLIVVEGPPAIGKGEICKKLAKELDMLYVPQTYLEDFYVRNYDFDLRTVDHLLPESCRTCDLPKFWNNATIANGGYLQILFYQLRFKKCIQILAHILSTGQGVVTERSPWSDQCFADVMFAHGYMSKEAYQAYNVIVEQSLHELMRPHLIVYLDVPVKNVEEKIKKRNKPGEAKIVNEKFLTDLENNYKHEYLRKMNTFSNILIYDYSHGGDFEVIVEDIEAIDFDTKEHNSKKFIDWDLKTCVQWTDHRRRYCETEEQMMIFTRTGTVNVPELGISGNDMVKRRYILRDHAPRQVWDSTYVPFEKVKFEKMLLEEVEYN